MLQRPQRLKKLLKKLQISCILTSLFLLFFALFSIFGFFLIFANNLLIHNPLPRAHFFQMSFNPWAQEHDLIDGHVERNKGVLDTLINNSSVLFLQGLARFYLLFPRILGGSHLGRQIPNWSLSLIYSLFFLRQGPLYYENLNIQVRGSTVGLQILFKTI